MITGVLATILAAASAALPFTPPSGWVQLPKSAVGVRVSNVWNGPKLPHGGQPTFSAVAFPFPGTVDLLASSAQTAASKTKLIKPVSNTAFKLCGVPARMIVTRVQAGGKATVLQQEIATKNGYAYMLMYTRPASGAADARVTQAMKSFCPSGDTAIAQLRMPGGWTKTNVDLQMDGMWMGPQPGQMLVLMRGSQMPSLDRVFQSAQNGSLHAPSEKSPVQIAARQNVTMCGYPGMLVDMKVTAGPMPAAIDMAITQGGGASYVLTYTRMGTAPEDANAAAALRTLCATGATPPLSPSPAPTPTPTPTPTPAP